VTAPKNKAQKRRDPKVQKGLPIDSALQFEELLKDISVIERYSLRLFVTGTTTRSAQAVANIRALCEEYLPGRYELEVIDIYQQPGKAVNEQIIAAPTLVKTFPKPLKRLIGDLSDRDKVIVGLDLRKSKTGKSMKWSVV
jgi:circadian clock protein KaiB